MMNPFRVLIADDDSGMRDILRRMVARAEGYQLVALAENGQDAIALAEEHRPHVVFLDVEMPGATGIECARVLQDMNPATVIIFATAHATYMSDAFALYAFDYLVKPFKMERVVQTLERARARLSMAAEAPLDTHLPQTPKKIEGKLLLHHRGGVSVLDMKDILLVQREDRATVLYTAKEERYVTADTLGEMEERLGGGPFFRCHKSYIINLNYVRDITPYGRWTYVVRLHGTKRDALITHEKYEYMEKMFH